MPEAWYKDRSKRSVRRPSLSFAPEGHERVAGGNPAKREQPPVHVDQGCRALEERKKGADIPLPPLRGFVDFSPLPGAALR